MTFLLKSGRVPQKFFSHFLQKCWLFLKKLLNEKIFKTSCPVKKIYIRFPHQTPPSLQKRLGLQKRVFAVFSENTVFFEKTAK